MSDLKSQVATGATWMVLLRLVVRLIGLISTLILVRLLAPTDFGIVAMAMSVVAILDLMAAYGFDVVLIQDQSADRSKYNTAWTFNAIFGFAVAAGLVLLAKPAARFYEEPRLVEVFMILSVTSILERLENIGLVDFRKHLQFPREFAFQVAVKAIAFVVTIALAFILRSYFALVFGIVASRVAALVLSYLMHPFRPRPSFAATGEIFGFSRWLLLNNVTYFLRFRATDFIVGKLAGPFGLGLFSVSYETSNLPTTELIAPINRALLPGLAKISDEPGRLRQAVVRATAVVALVSLPAGFGIAATADYLIPVMLGAKWMDAVPLMGVLAMFGTVVAITSPIGSALLAIGRPKVPALVGIASAAVLIPSAIMMTSKLGPQGTALALLITALMFLPVNYAVARKYLGLTIRDTGRILFRPTIATIVMYVTVRKLLDHFGAPDELPVAAIHLSIAVAVGVVSYALSILALWMMATRPDGAEAFAIEWLQDRFSWLHRRTNRSHAL